MSLKIGNLSKVSPRVEALVKAFYKTMENEAAYNEKYEEAAKWRDAHLHEYVVIDLDHETGKWSFGNAGPLAAGKETVK